MFAVMAMARQHVFQVLTKRPERMRQYLSERVGDHPGETVVERLEKIINSRFEGRLVTWPWAHTEEEQWPLKNVWVGTSVEDQEAVNDRVLTLMQTPATVRWLSVEPLLEEATILVDLRRGIGSPIHWVVCGGESGSRTPANGTRLGSLHPGSVQDRGRTVLHEADGGQAGDPRGPDDQGIPNKGVTMSVHIEEKRIVEQLSAVMMTKLAVNRYKPIWTTATPDYLCKLLHAKLSDLALSLYAGRNRDAVMECADAANYLAMIADISLTNMRRGKTGGE